MPLKRWFISEFPDPAVEYELAEGQTAEDTFIISIQVSNKSGTDATFTFHFTDGTTTQNSYDIVKAAGESPSFFDSVIVLMPGDKLLITCDQAACSVRANGEVK